METFPMIQGLAKAWRFALSTIVVWVEAPCPPTNLNTQQL
uniref:Uncharacterized protein n=1 Tax=Brassica campestris TaxID=3711 RepID=A0A3P5ZHQ0_BRACM|nr:unnamed protein product [Brassica rapa]